MATNRMGPPCPECGSLTTDIYRTRRTRDGHFWRLRSCPVCSHRFATLQPSEVVAPEGAAGWTGRNVLINWTPLRHYFARLITSSPC